MMKFFYAKLEEIVGIFLNFHLKISWNRTLAMGNSVCKQNLDTVLLKKGIYMWKLEILISVLPKSSKNASSYQLTSSSPPAHCCAGWC